jgi:hypothetical protein
MEVNVMGLACSCGFIIPNAQATPTIVRFFTETGSEDRPGIITYDVDVCDNQLGQSFANFSFDDTSGLTPDRSFSFESTVITSVNCIITTQGDCLIQVNGMGLLDDETQPREFIVLLTQSPNLPIIVGLNFEIVDFAATPTNTGVFNTEVSNIEVFGCF